MSNRLKGMRIKPNLIMLYQTLGLIPQIFESILHLVELVKDIKSAQAEKLFQ